jgi:hypothetical protein
MIMVCIKPPHPPYWDRRAKLVICLEQRPCADVNSPYQQNAELTQWALFINNYSEHLTHPFA